MKTIILELDLDDCILIRNALSDSQWNVKSLRVERLIELFETFTGQRSPMLHRSVAPHR